jgi:hypothetical protein
MKSLALISGMFFTQSIFAQDLDKIGSKDWLTCSGQIGQEFQFIPNSGSPFRSISTASLQTKIIGIQLPFQLRFASGAFQGSHPFNGIRFAPSYKWFRVQTGICSVEQDQYTLRGVPFKGAAMHLSPGSIKTQIFYGVLNTNESFTETENFLKKKTAGFSLENQWKKILFRTHALSIWTENLNENTSIIGIHHHNGLVWSIDVRGEINKKLHVHVQQAYSLFATLHGTEKWTPLFALFQLNNCNHSHAGNYSIEYKNKSHLLSMQYQYTPSDFYQAGIAVPSFNLKKIALAYNFQKKNFKLNFKSGLENDISSIQGIGNTRKLSSSIHLHYNQSKWSVTSSYDNFTSLSRFNPIQDDQWEIPQDSLQLFAVRQNANLQFRYGEKTKKISFHAGAQFNDVTQAFALDQSLRFTPTIRANTGFKYNLPAQKSSLQGSLVWMKNDVKQELGPSLQYNVDARKLKISIQSQARFETNSWRFDHMQSRLQLNYAFDPKNKIRDKFQCSLQLAHRMKQHLHEFQMMFRMNYQFQ